MATLGEIDGKPGSERDTRGPGGREFVGMFARGMFDCLDGEACGGGAVRLGMELLAAGPGAAELVFPGPALGKMQGEPACRAGEPSGEREEAPPEGLGGGRRLSQTDARCPAGQVMGQHLHRQPGAVGSEAARGHVVQPGAVLEVPDGVLDPGVAAVAGLQFPSSSKVSPSRPVMKP